MPRPCKRRRVDVLPEVDFFKPQGVPMKGLEVVELGVDELEAMRLADLEGLYQADAAEKMGVSRQTFGNIISSARKKVTLALTTGCAIKIENRSFVRPQRPDCPGRGRRRGAGRCGTNVNKPE